MGQRKQRQQLRQDNRGSGSEWTYEQRHGARGKQLRGLPCPALQTLIKQTKKVKFTATRGAVTAKPFRTHAHLTGPPGRRTGGPQRPQTTVPGSRSGQEEPSKGQWRPRCQRLTHTPFLSTQTRGAEGPAEHSSTQHSPTPKHQYRI